MRHVAKTLLILSAILFSFASCQQAEELAEAGVYAAPQGLIVLSASETSLAMMYRKGDTVIFMEALRGERTPEMYQMDPDSPEFEVDARFLAENGRPIYTVRGGDEWLDPTWVYDLEEMDDRYPTRESNLKYLLVAAEASAAMDQAIVNQVGADLAEKMSHLVRPLRGFGAIAPGVYGDLKVKLHDHLLDIGFISQADLDEAAQNAGTITYSSNDKGGECDAWTNWSSNYYAIQVFDASAFVIARHSATRLWQWQGYWLHVHDTCNHGRCAWEMSHKCTLEYYDALEQYKPAWQLQSCGTVYNAFSNDGHNCHDDTRVQMANFVYGHGANLGPGARFWCWGDDDSDISSPPGDQGGSPECTNSRYNGYRHNHMCQYQPSGTVWNSQGQCYCDQSCKSFGDCCIDGPWPR